MRYFYFDTSALAKRYSFEIGSEQVDSLIADEKNVIVIGNIAITEIYSALSKKVRTREITQHDFLSAVYNFEKDIAKNSYRFLEVDNDIVTATKRLILTYPELRTYDSIHLALALELSELTPCVVTSDIVLYRTCQAEGLQVINPE
ncbi:MAG: type II toxin-antitoxin system VapC family toxin [Nitrospirae bacterium]|nr:type II toxin-antitoxin system VapC family toxin [Nitrospirota bacterium]